MRFFIAADFATFSLDFHSRTCIIAAIFYTNLERRNMPLSNNQSDHITELFLKHNQEYQEVQCPKCQKIAIQSFFKQAEHAQRGTRTPKTKRITLFVVCLHCGFDSEDDNELRSFGIEPEVEI